MNIEKQIICNALQKNELTWILWKKALKKIPLYGADALGKTDKEEEKCNQTTTQLKQQHAG